MSDVQTQTALAQVEFRFREKDGVKRDTLELKVPFPTAAYLVSVLEREDGDKVKDSVLDAVNGLITNYLRGKVNENTEFSQETLDAMVEKGELSIDYIGNMPRSQRNTITNAMLAAFGLSFINTAKAVENDPELRIASEKGAQIAASAFADRLRAAVGKDELLQRLDEMLDKYCEATSEAELDEHLAVVENLKQRIEDSRQKEELSLDNLS